MSRILNFLAWIAGFMLLPSVHAATEYSNARQLPAIRMSYSDLQEVIDRIDSLVGRFHSGTDQRLPMHVQSLSIHSGGQVFTAEGEHIEIARMGNLPDSAYEGRYRYRPSGDSISNIELTLRHYVREISVTGSRDEVDALVTTISEVFENHAVFKGSRVGMGVSAVIGVAAFLISLKLGFRYLSLLLGFTIAWAAYALWLLIGAFGDFLSDFVIYEGEVSFVRRYTAEITFVGTLVSLLVLAWPLARYVGSLTSTHEERQRSQQKGS